MQEGGGCQRALPPSTCRLSSRCRCAHRHGCRAPAACLGASRPLSGDYLAVEQRQAAAAARKFDLQLRDAISKTAGRARLAARRLKCRRSDRMRPADSLWRAAARQSTFSPLAARGSFLQSRSHLHRWIVRHRRMGKQTRDWHALSFPARALVAVTPGVSREGASAFIARLLQPFYDHSALIMLPRSGSATAEPCLHEASSSMHAATVAFLRELPTCPSRQGCMTNGFPSAAWQRSKRPHLHNAKGGY